MVTRRSPVLAGFAASLPFAPAIAAWGIAFGAAAASAGLPAGYAIAMSAIVFSGTAQMAGLSMAHGSLAGLLATSLVVSLRFVPMTLTLGAKLRATPAWRRALASYFIVDGSFALLTRVRERHFAYLVGTWFVFYGTWVAGTAAGLFGAHLLPFNLAGVSDALVAGIFALLAIDACRTRRMAAVAGLAAVLVLLVAAVLPAGGAVLVAALAAAALGSLWPD